jgi:hypothetical protein
LVTIWLDGLAMVEIDQRSFHKMGCNVACITKSVHGSVTHLLSISYFLNHKFKGFLLGCILKSAYNQA